MNRGSGSGDGEIVVVSCYELGHQPLAAASLLGFLERAGHSTVALDLSVDPAALDGTSVPGTALLVAVSVPMHTALHVGVRAARKLRILAPRAHLCFYGHYAALNAAHLFDAGLADSVAAGECETALLDLADALRDGRPLAEVEGLGLPDRPAEPVMNRLDFPAPSRGKLPGIERYAKLVHRGETLPAAAVETSRGCLHVCRHCPITPVYRGRFFVVPRQVVLADIEGLVARGVRHVTFADPDFLNGPGHSMAIVRAMHAAWPELTFDCTIKVEHVLERRELFPELAERGCLFVVTAVESLSDTVLDHLAKGHRREDVFAAQQVLDGAGIAMRPSLVAFTPWTRIADYLELIDWVEQRQLVDHLEPVQFSIRLLVPPGSPLAGSEAMRPYLGPLDPASFQHPWTHPDPAMDRLQQEVAARVDQAARSSEPATKTFSAIRELARRADPDPGRSTDPTSFLPARAAAPPPRLTEPWFC